MTLTAGAQPKADQPLNRSTAVALMSPGVNLGNTLEAIPNETSWGNPVPTSAYFKGVRAVGFRSIRIPVGWSQYCDAQNNISPKWMGHVTEVVRMARDADLIVMINIHWDGGWLIPTPEKRDQAKAKLSKLWTQIATNFRDFDDHLLFAGTNEIGVPGEYGPPAATNAQIQNEFNQVFVDTVRATGGRNRSRLLVVQGFNTDIDTALKVNLTMPKDVMRNRLMFEVHYYTPYNFTLNDKSNVWQWGKTATDPKATDTYGNEDYVDTEFSKMKSSFGDLGIPVILGEYSAGMKDRFPGMDPYRKLWDEYVTRSAIKHGIVPMLWDTGSIIDRRTGAPRDADLIKRIMAASAQ